MSVCVTKTAFVQNFAEHFALMSRNHHCAYVIHDKPRFQKGFAQSQVCNGLGLVSLDELWILHCHTARVRRSTLFYKGFQSSNPQTNFFLVLYLSNFLHLNAYHKIGSGERSLLEEDWEELDARIETDDCETETFCKITSCSPKAIHPEPEATLSRRRNPMLSTIYSVSQMFTFNCTSFFENC